MAVRLIMSASASVSWRVLRAWPKMCLIMRASADVSWRVLRLLSQIRLPGPQVLAWDAASAAPCCLPRAVAASGNKRRMLSTASGLPANPRRLSTLANALPARSITVLHDRAKIRYVSGKGDRTAAIWQHVQSPARARPARAPPRLAVTCGSACPWRGQGGTLDFGRESPLMLTMALVATSRASCSNTPRQRNTSLDNCSPGGAGMLAKLLAHGVGALARDQVADGLNHGPHAALA